MCKSHVTDRIYPKKKKKRTKGRPVRLQGREQGPRGLEIRWLERSIRGRPHRLQRLWVKVFSIPKAKVRSVPQSDLCSARITPALRWRVDVRRHQQKEADHGRS